MVLSNPYFSKCFAFLVNLDKNYLSDFFIERLDLHLDRDSCGLFTYIPCTENCFSVFIFGSLLSAYFMLLN